MRLAAVIALAMLALLPVAAAAEGLVAPPLPEAGDYPTPPGYLRFYATSVSRMTDGSSLVQYGYLFGRLDGHVLMVLENRDEGLVCRGETGRKGWPENRSVVTCTKFGKAHSHSDMEIRGKKSRSPAGSVTSPILDDAGRVVGESVLRWNPLRFPAPK